jgi:hypothetical protein
VSVFAIRPAGFPACADRFSREREDMSPDSREGCRDLCEAVTTYIAAAPAANEMRNGAHRRSAFHRIMPKVEAIADFDDSREPVFRLTSAVHLQGRG